MTRYLGLCVLMSLALLHIISVLEGLSLPLVLLNGVGMPLIIGLQVMNGIWAILFLYTALRLFQKRPHTLRYTGRVIAAFCLYTAVRFITVVQADYDRGRIPLLIVLLGLCAFGSWWLTRPNEQHT